MSAKQEHDNQTDGSEVPRKVWISASLSLVLLVIWSLVPLLLPDLDTFVWNSISLIGVALTIVAIGIAFLIFRKQDRDSAQAQTQTNGKLDKISDQMRKFTDRAAQTPLSSIEERYQEDEESHGEEDDEHVIESAKGSTRVVDGKKGTVLQQEDVPLYVIGDLATAWRDMPDQSGRWTVSNLVDAWRADGQGNNPWYVTFESTNGDQRVWRLYRGGKSKRTPTARDVTPDMMAQ
ncbi:hypothetical protein F8O06_04940 [Pseudoclavibacter sp. CFCC 14310]|uniref:hypothetical protein n=1 Tax=Pseudoclavibacter sp. CFCC 14310 TaxID=2615180 RepID=UPI00130199AA|nr:hypothetical protein [Pseudoclavibacter sp. CFCC 14310]KAB1645429.1 hypothetical protein F8O06_07505 [Pseudoclavibacter sp. CFCC 14310]KAB1646112.1 hypothetical protein F8O06_04940 [Pseudoclavibacter sp. CFCC 14310]